jgi:predicted membrane protein
MNSFPRISAQFIFGLGIIAIGVLFTLDNLDIIYARDYLRYWPAILILVGMVQLVQPQGTPGKLMGGILLTAGSLMLLDRFDIIDFSFWDLWPIFIILFGFSLLRGVRGRSSGSRRASTNPDHEEASGIFVKVEQNMFPSKERGSGGNDTDDYINGMAILGGFSRKSNAKDFQGGELTAVMGGCELDLRNAILKGDEATIEIFALWGGVVIRVPEDWTVVVKVSPIMGGVEDTSLPPKNGPDKRLIITGFTIMGGAEIKN